MTNLFKNRSLEDLLLDPKNQQAPRRLFGDYMFAGEICGLFGDSNAGKSIVVSDMALSMAYGISHWEEPMTEGKGVKVLWCDLELNQSQIARRLAGAVPLMQNIGGSIVRAEFKPGAHSKATMDLFLENLTNYLGDAETRPDVVIMDNLMCIASYTSPKAIRKLMQELKHLAYAYDVSFLIVGHTRKRNLSKAVTQNDLAGTKVLMNYFDSAFVVCESAKDTGTRYFKLIKTRQKAKINDVAEVEISDEPYLHYEFVEYNEEKEHLADRALNHETIGPVEEKLILDMRKKGHSIRQISDEMCISKSTIHRFLKDKGKN